MHVIKTDQKKESFWKIFFKQLSSNHIFESSATLSYYFLFSVFPLIIFISAAFSMLHISPDQLTYLSRIIPEQIVNVFQGYLREITLGNTPTLIIIGSLLTLYSLGKALQTMKRKFRFAYGADPQISWFKEWVVTMIFVFLILFSFYATLILIVTGNNILNNLVSIFPSIGRTRGFIQLFRYAAVTAYLAFVLYGLYYVLPGIKQKARFILPGTFFSLAGWMLISWLFSIYFSYFSNITSLYGSLGTIIALLTWLYLINTVLLVGVNINSYIYKKSAERKL